MDDCRKIVAYFDFDGTISNRDTFIPFLVFTVGKITFLRKLPKLIPVLLRYWCKNITNEQAKQATLNILIHGYKQVFLEHKAKSFAISKLNKYIKPAVYAKLEWHREHKHTLVIVSANLGIYLRYWAHLHKIDHVIATEIEFINSNVASGRLATHNCYGSEKVNRIENFLIDNKLTFCYSYGYGNSAGDYAMLNYVNEGYFVNGDYMRRWGL